MSFLKRRSCSCANTFVRQRTAVGYRVIESYGLATGGFFSSSPAKPTTFALGPQEQRSAKALAEIPALFPKEKKGENTGRSNQIDCSPGPFKSKN